MNTVTFGNYNSYDDLNLILSLKTIGSPSTKTESVDIPGADGTLDFTEFFGEPKYNNRTLTFEFSSIHPDAEQDSNVKNVLHGQKLKISLSESPEFYFYGRVSVGDWKVEKSIAKLTISCDCEPWRYKTEETIETFSITSSGYITLSNLRRSVVPQITTDADITVAWTGGSASLSAGEDIVIPELILRAGETAIQITGTATVTFKYQEGCL